ncbi:uncharacterized protein LACBIDRAFT_304758 [Laccaria bicolor S238N-H82]|uniref:Predicted protein n=1 Tax=Laccaria bicolor (strain S238N-H82 / ATCC MYA-4686) TaxID=486041 RepID=B0DM97_LACBS|nr:uncharacterized protein LACBIDRAFT_304758 [Laccaria bicolor S238N-H82]EDR04242.1 predicted protein [Laccaria bicolor S238N-H82]|eukprot:XP_001885133.1 predicted protein [Laccaria bicolor S238N-H82]
MDFVINPCTWKTHPPPPLLLKVQSFIYSIQHLNRIKRCRTTALNYLRSALRSQAS